MKCRADWRPYRVAETICRRRRASTPHSADSNRDVLGRNRIQACETVREEVDHAQRQLQRLNDVITALLARARDDSAAPTHLDLTALVRQEAGVGTGTDEARPQPAAQPGRWRGGAVAHERREHIVAITSSLLENALHYGTG